MPHSEYGWHVPRQKSRPQANLETPHPLPNLYLKRLHGAAPDDKLPSTYVIIKPHILWHVCMQISIHDFYQVLSIKYYLIPILLILSNLKSFESLEISLFCCGCSTQYIWAPLCDVGVQFSSVHPTPSLLARYETQSNVLLNHQSYIREMSSKSQQHIQNYHLQ